MEELSKEKNLEKLYELRAGISLISKMKDKVTAVATEQTALQKENTLLKEEYENADNSFKDKKQEWTQDIEFWNKNLEEHRHFLNRSKNNIRERMRSLGFWLLICTVMIIGAIILLIWVEKLHEKLSKMIGTEEISMLLILSLLIILVVLFIMGIRFIISNLQDIRSERALFSSSLECVKSEEKYLYELQSNKDRELAILSKTNKKIKERTDNKINCNQGKLEEYDNNIKVEIKKFDAVYATLKENYAIYLDERDWEYLDLFIFSYETGRAETKKEALAFVDMERRSQQLNLTINNALQEVCNGVKRIENTMVECFIELNENLQNALQDIDNKLWRITEQNSQIIEQSERIIKQNSALQEGIREMAANNMAQLALQEKINETSCKLVEDLRYIRDYGAERYRQ